MTQTVSSREHFLERIASRVKLKSDCPYVIALDGRSGAGKTTLAGHIADYLNSRQIPVAVFHLEDTYQGWEGLSAAVTQWRKVSASLESGHPLLYFGWDWATSRPTGPHVRKVSPGTVLIVEGVGAAQGKTDLNCWVQVPDSVRKDRALARDGDTYRPYWEIWAAQEEAIAPLYQKTEIDIVFEPECAGR